MVSIIPPALAVSVALLACSSGGDGGGGGGPTPGTPLLAPASPSGAGQTAQVGTELPLPLRVHLTQDGLPLAGRVITWSTASGTVAPAGPTDASGVAEATWTLGTLAGAVQATAALSGASGSPFGFVATASPGPAASLLVVSGDGQGVRTGTAFQPLSVRLRDAFGNGIAGGGVSWMVLAGDASVNPDASQTAADGTAQTQAQAGAAPGAISIRASVAALPPVDFAAESGSVLVVNTAFNPSQLTVPAGTTVRWVWPQNSLGHNVAPDASEPARSGDPANGLLAYEHTFTTPGTYEYHCEVHGGPGGLGMSGVITVTP